MQHSEFRCHVNVMTGPSTFHFCELLSILCELFRFVYGLWGLKITVKNVAPYEVFALSLHASIAAVCRFAIAVVVIPAY